MRKKEKKREYCVYRYTLIENGEIIYIGKTDASLKQRITAHETEEKFLPYNGFFTVDYIELANSVETDIVEKFLINQFKPILNEKDHVEGLTDMNITLPQWKSYAEYMKSKKETLEELRKTARIDDMLLEKTQDAVLEGKSNFISSILHTSGLLPFLFGRIRATKPNTLATSQGYIYELEIENARKVSNYYNYIRYLIWRPVANVWSFSQKDADALQSYEAELNDIIKYDNPEKERNKIEEYAIKILLIYKITGVIPYLEEETAV